MPFAFDNRPAKVLLKMRKAAAKQKKINKKQSRR